MGWRTTIYTRTVHSSTLSDEESEGCYAGGVRDGILPLLKYKSICEFNFG